VSFLGHRRVLVVTAVEPERQAVLRALSTRGTDPAVIDAVVVEVGGVGAAAVAATTARVLATGRFDAALSVGIGGGFTVGVGGVAVATTSVAADLGADSPDGFLSLDRLGFGTSSYAADPGLVTAMTAALPGACVGPVLTVATVTGTATGTREMLRRHPDAVAEAMEGFGVATAAAQAGVAFGELRAMSNLVGPRDRGEWRIGDAMDGLSEAVNCLAKLTT
jgi:futalosine hydrolase